MTEDKVLVTHRGTIDNIRKIQRDMIIKANYPTPDNKLMRLIEDKNEVVWVSKGKPNPWNMIWSGMCGKRDKACVIFEIESNRLRKPNGIMKRMFSGWIFGKAQLVIDGDVKIPGNAIFKYKTKGSL